MLVPNTYSESVHPRKDVELCQVDSAVSIQAGGVFCDNGIKPTTATWTTCRRTVFATFFTQMYSKLIIEFGWKRACAHTSGISFYNTCQACQMTTRNSCAGAKTVNHRVGACDKRISTMVYIKHHPVCTFKNNGFSGFKSFMQIHESIYNHGLYSGAHSFVLLDFRINIISKAIHLGQNFYIRPKLHLKNLLVKEITPPNASARNLIGITRTYTTLSGTNLLVSFTVLLNAIDLHVIAEEQMSSVGNKNTAFRVNPGGLKYRDLFK